VTEDNEEKLVKNILVAFQENRIRTVRRNGGMPEESGTKAALGLNNSE
jgi:hypothetical protein